MGSAIEGCFGSYSINFQIYTFTITTDWVKFQVIQDDITFKVGEIIRVHGAEIAFPTSDIHLSSTEQKVIDKL
jgi:MscS family membrane protein